MDQPVPDPTKQTTPEQTLEVGGERDWVGRLMADMMLGQWLPARAAQEAPAEEAGSCIGPYKLLQQLGEGGMGIVFRAEQKEPVRRTVALKVIKAGMDTVRVVARFEAERQALALMDHPHIAKVLDAGTTPSGRPYFVMELVKGTPITTYCDEQRLTLRQRLELFVPVCQAIQHAHQKDIIHRDIKPSNVLVASYDGKPVPKVIDFGVAKATGGKLADQTLFTGFGALVGTLEYMSPEQAEFNAVDIDTCSDIYSLGVLLYELLTGTTPLTRQRVRDAALQDVLRWIREEEPPCPSTRLNEAKESSTWMSEQRHREPAALVKALRGEVDWIVMKCLEKDRTRRYETANGLARDIQRYLAEEAVEAGPPSETYRLRKLAWKHRRGLATAVALSLLLVAGSVLSAWQAVRAPKAEGRVLGAEKESRLAEQAALEDRNRAQTAEKAAKQSEEDTKTVLEFFQNKVLAAGRPKNQEGGLGNKVSLREAVDVAESAIAKAFADRTLVEASIRDTLGLTYWYLGDYPPAIRQLARALELREAKVGPNHPDTLDSRNNLAVAYDDAGRIADAIRLHEQTLKQSEAKLGVDHLATLTSRSNLATAYLSIGRTDEAIRLHEQTLKQREAKLGPDHRETLISRYKLAKAYDGAGEFTKSESLYRDVLEQTRKRFGAKHATTVERMAALGSNLLHQHKYADAERLLHNCLKFRQAKRPEEWETFHTQSLLGEALLGQKKDTDAEPLFLQGYQGMKEREAKIPPQGKIRLTEAIERLVQLYEATGKKDEAEKWRKELKQARKANIKDTAEK